MNLSWSDFFFAFPNSGLGILVAILLVPMLSAAMGVIFISSLL